MHRKFTILVTYKMTDTNPSLLLSLLSLNEIGG